MPDAELKIKNKYLGLLFIEGLCSDRDGCIPRCYITERVEDKTLVNFRKSNEKL